MQLAIKRYENTTTYFKMCKIIQQFNQDVTTTPQLQINNCQYFGEWCSLFLIYLQCFHHMFTAWTLNNVNAAAQDPSLLSHYGHF